MKVYVAGASGEMDERAVPAIKALREGGIEVSFDWTENMLKRREVGLHDHHLSSRERRVYADKNISAVLASDYVLFLEPKGPCAGAWAELGAAYASDIWVVACGPGLSIFTELAGSRFETDAEGVAFLVRHAQANYP